MLKQLIKKYGKEKINTLTKYPSILTLHKLNEKGRFTEEFTTNINGELMYATEKIDGTNVRIVLFGDQYLIGSRENILHHSDDLYFDNAMGIVEGIKKIGNFQKHLMPFNSFTVIYGEFFGGKITANSKQYGKDKTSFRVFDLAVFEDLSILELSQEKISKWREKETENGIIYGQNFFDKKDLELYLQFMTLFMGFEADIVPSIEFETGDMSIETISKNLRKFLPKTNVALSEQAEGKAEGIVLRNENRTKIVKLRFEDYEKVFASIK
jgi:hypothetical protein